MWSLYRHLLACVHDKEAGNDLEARKLGLAILTYIDRGQSPLRILTFFVNAKIQRARARADVRV